MASHLVKSWLALPFISYVALIKLLNLCKQQFTFSQNILVLTAFKCINFTTLSYQVAYSYLPYYQKVQSWLNCFSWLYSKLKSTLFLIIFFKVFKKIYLLIMLLQLSHFPPPPTPLHPAYPFPPTFPPYSSCPWVILISSLASAFPTLFLPSPCPFSSTYHLCYLFSVPFPSLPLPLPY